MRALLASVVIAFTAQAEPPHASLAIVPARMRAGLAAAIPRSASLTWYGEKAGVITILGTAKSFDDVSEFMRALNNVVQCPRGLARVVERQRSGALRVELIGAPTQVVEYPPADVHFLFSGIELRSTVKKRDMVDFELTFPASP